MAYIEPRQKLELQNIVYYYKEGKTGVSWGDSTALLLKDFCFFVALEKMSHGLWKVGAFGLLP